MTQRTEADGESGEDDSEGEAPGKCKPKGFGNQGLGLRV